MVIFLRYFAEALINKIRLFANDISSICFINVLIFNIIFTGLHFGIP